MDGSAQPGQHVAMVHPDAALASLLRTQAGAVSAKQLLALGFSRRQIERLARRWVRVASGIFVEAMTFAAAVWAGLLRGGEGAVVGGEAAGHLAGFLPTEPRTVVVWARHVHEDMRVGPWLVQFRQGKRGGRGTPPATRPEVTVLDIAERSSEVDAVGALTRALAERHTTGERVARELNGRGRQRHRRLIARLCEEGEAGIESALEYLLLRNVIRAHGLPEPDRQRRRTAGRVDNHYDEYGLIVEADGASHHRDKAHDYFRDNEHLLVHDERTLRFGWVQVNAQACRAADQLARGLEQGGWDGNRGSTTCDCNTE